MHEQPCANLDDRVYSGFDPWIKRDTPVPDLNLDDDAHTLSTRLDRSVVLVGLMGVGKSTIGRKLAARLGWGFYDADEEIEKAAGLSVSDIFATLGEAAFRDGERRVIKRLMTAEPAVIATGGGAFVDPETRELILNQGLAIWLNADIDVLLERTGRRDTRPLLKQGDPRTILSELAHKRAPFYQMAPIHAQSGRTNPDQTVSVVLTALEKYLA
jgi:shikimate kinase